MAGYSGQLVALDEETPTEASAQAAQAQLAQTQSQLATQTLPTEVALKQAQLQGAQGDVQARNIANQSAQLTLQQQMQLNAAREHWITEQTQQPGAGTQSTPPSQPQLPSLFAPQVQQVIQSIDPDDPQAAAKFDAGMRGIQDEVPQASQFVGSYSKANIQNWRSAIGRTAATPQSQLGGGVSGVSPPTGSAPGTPSGGATQLSPALTEMSIRDPEGTGKMLQMQAMLKYQQTGDPSVLARSAPDLYAKLQSAAKDMTDAQKTQLQMQTDTMGQQANAVLYLASKLGNDAPEVRAAYDQSVTNAAKHGWITPQDAAQRLNAPITKGTIAELSFMANSSQTVSDFMKNSGAAAAADAQAKAQNPTPENVLVGYDSAGHPVFSNAHSQPGTPTWTGQTPVAGSRTGGTVDAFSAKRTAWLTDHPGDETGADLFANGQHVMTPGQAQISAAAAAARDASSAALTGQPFDEQGARQKYYQLFTSPGEGGPSVAPTVPAGAGPGGHTAAQLAAAQQFVGKGTAQQLGSRANPYMPANSTQYGGLPKGAVYIGPDGKLYQKQ